MKLSRSCLAPLVMAVALPCAAAEFQNLGFDDADLTGLLSTNYLGNLVLGYGFTNGVRKASPLSRKPGCHGALIRPQACRSDADATFDLLSGARHLSPKRTEALKKSFSDYLLACSYYSLAGPLWH